MYPNDNPQQNRSTEYSAIIVEETQQSQSPKVQSLQDKLVPLLGTVSFLLSICLSINTFFNFKAGTVMHRYNTGDLNSTQALDQIKDLGLPYGGIVNIMVFVALIALSVIALTNNPCSRMPNNDTETSATDGSRRTILGMFWNRRTMPTEAHERTALLLTEGGENSCPAQQP